MIQATETGDSRWKDISMKADYGFSKWAHLPASQLPSLHYDINDSITVQSSWKNSRLHK